MKYILITGANGGLGTIACNALLNENTTIFACGLDISSYKDNTNKNLIPIKLDVTDTFSIENAFNKISKITKKLDSIINCAGIITLQTLIEVDLSEAEKIMNINLFGAMRVNKIMFPLLKKGSRIINISSETGIFTSQPFNGLYCISKHALEAYNDSLRRELTYLGIDVIKIQPGSFKTKMHENTLKSNEALLESTKLFKKEVKQLNKLTKVALEKYNDPKYFELAILDAVNNEKPKLNYRVKNTVSTRIINLLPEKIIDKIYKKAFQ